MSLVINRTNAASNRLLERWTNIHLGCTEDWQSCVKSITRREEPLGVGLSEMCASASLHFTRLFPEGSKQPACLPV